MTKFEGKLITLYWNREPILVTLWEWWQWENVFVKRRSTLAWSSDATCPMKWVPSVPPSSRKPPRLGTSLGHRYHSGRAHWWEFLKTVAHRTFSNFEFPSFVRFLQFFVTFFEVIEALQPESPSLRWVPSPSCLFITCLNLSKRDFLGLAHLSGRFSDQDFHNPPRSKSLNEHNSGQLFDRSQMWN